MDSTVHASPFRDESPFHRLLVVLLLVGLGTLTMVGCDDGQASDEESSAPSRPPATRVETLVLEPTSFTDRIEITGTVEAIHDATVSAQASGTVIDVAEVGTVVPKGGVVAQLDSNEAHAAVEQARAQYELAQDRYDRQEPLYRDSIIAALEFEQVRSQLTQARAALSQARTRLRNLSVTVPFSGTVEERFVEPGEQTAPGEEVARILDVRPVKVVAGVPERYAGDIETGTPVRVRFRTSQLGERTGTITFVGSAIDPESRTFTVEATLPNTDRTIKPEMAVQMRMTRATVEEALVIPRTAVVRDEAGEHVYVVERTDTSAVARKRDITLGASTGARVVVAAGVETGTEIIIVGQSNLAPGSPVEITQQYDRVSDAGTPFRADESSSPPSD
jgi:RND family efflux transporter MFP subunit